MRQVTVQWLCENPDGWWHGLNESGKFPRAFIHGIQLRHCLRPFWFEADQTSCVVIPQDYELHAWRTGMSDVVELFEVDETVPAAYHCGPKIGPDGNVIPDTSFRMGPRGTTIHPVLARELVENIRDWHNAVTSPSGANLPHAYIEVEGVLNRIVHASDWRPRYNTIDVSYQPDHLLMGVYSNLCKPDDVLWLESAAPAPAPYDSPVDDDDPTLLEVREDDDIQASFTAEDQEEMAAFIRDVAAAEVAHAEALARLPRRLGPPDRTPNILAPFNAALVHGVAENPLRTLNQGELDRMRAVAREMAVWGVWDGFSRGVDIIEPQRVYDRVLMGGLRQAHLTLEEGVHYRFIEVNDELLRATTPPEQRWRMPHLFGFGEVA